ncbi:uncharacterized protein LOC111263530 [Varroa jacobsoni]|uniref:uncharacterized protein LOC111263530 n=1 Tax=Varroa jacobsoni TaxID=62625 RepID=UPI000BF37F2E|nr:uncharacterized protein LOC111263530 [Varroa jacobsoni]XP_022694409.1 uncharacterized protein LOC111263530 [Varroa jacobsoni]
MPNKVAPFWAFYKRYENEQRRKGRRFTREEMYDEASQFWGQMNQDDRAYFVDDAKEATKKLREDLWSRLEKKRELQKNLQCTPQDTGVEDILEFNIDRVMKQLAEQPKVIREMEFCFFDANIQCFVENLRADGSMTMDLRPCEIALCRFSIANGIINRWHGIIYPGRPFGMSRNRIKEAKFQCMMTHGIPFEGLPNTTCNIKKFWHSAQKFFAGATLVTSLDYRNAVGALIYFLQRCNIVETPYIIDAGRLMDRIQESLGCKPPPSARAALDNAVNVSSVKGDEVDMSCSYHVTNVGWKYCVLLRMTKLAFEFSRQLAEPFEVEPLIPGAHTPDDRNDIPVVEYQESADNQNSHDNDAATGLLSSSSQN